MFLFLSLILKDYFLCEMVARDDTSVVGPFY